MGSEIRQKTQVIPIQKLNQLHRTIRHLACRCGPSDLAIVDFQCDDPLIGLTPSVNDDRATVNTWRTRESPHRWLCTTRNFLQVHFPNQTAVDRIEPHQNPLGSQSINRTIRKRWRPARTESPERFKEPRRRFKIPNRLACLRIVTSHHLVLLTLLLRKEPIGANGKRTPSRSDPFAPDLLRR